VHRYPPAYEGATRRHALKLHNHLLLLASGKPNYNYQLTAKGIRVALLFVLFHKRVCGPLANSLFARRPSSAQPASKTEAAYQQGDQSIQRVIDLLAA
jgi:hypothetical protein